MYQRMLYIKQPSVKEVRFGKLLMESISAMNKGETRNYLTMVSDKFKRSDKCNSRAMFQCVCGKIKEIGVSNVASGKTKSCGCMSKILWQQSEYGKSKHHGRFTRLYSIYAAMKQRCCNPNYFESQYYGGRGITICDEWKNNFVAFRDWAMANGYKDGLSIDRVNTNKGYSPDNCRWATAKEQSRNKRNNIMITLNGETHCLIEWCEILDLPYQTIEMRIHRGWDKEKAITTPIKKEGA